MEAEAEEIQRDRNPANSGTRTSGNSPTPQEEDNLHHTVSPDLPSDRVQRAVVEMHQQDTQNHNSWRIVDMKMICKRRTRKVLMKITKHGFAKGNEKIVAQIKAYIRKELNLSLDEFNSHWPVLQKVIVKCMRNLRTEYTNKMKMRFYCECPLALRQSGCPFFSSTSSFGSKCCCRIRKRGAFPTPGLIS